MFSTKIKIFTASFLQKIINFFYKDTSNIYSVRNGIHWNLDLREGIDFSIFIFGYFEKETTKALYRIIKKKDVVIDIGANIGAHTLYMAKNVGDEGKVYAIEPTNYAFNKLTNNVAINPDVRNRIIANQLLLVSKYNKDTVINGIYSSWPLVNTKNRHHVHCGIEMSISNAEKITIDNMVVNQKISKIDVIKLDVDGNELDILIGGQNSITKFRPIFVMELGPDQYEKNSNFDKVIQLMVSMGYEFYSLNESVKYPNDSILIRKLIPKMGSINVIAKMHVKN
jgi:FkbM family methyltransferase